MVAGKFRTDPPAEWATPLTVSTWWTSLAIVSEVINVHEASPLLSRLLDKAHAGEEFVLAKAGPYGRMLAAQADVEGLTWVGKVRALRQFGVELLW